VTAGREGGGWRLDVGGWGVGIEKEGQNRDRGIGEEREGEGRGERYHT
jgi:hypothetical protein